MITGCLSGLAGQDELVRQDLLTRADSLVQPIEQLEIDSVEVSIEQLPPIVGGSVDLWLPELIVRCLRVGDGRLLLLTTLTHRSVGNANGLAFVTTLFQHGVSRA